MELGYLTRGNMADDLFFAEDEEEVEAGEKLDPWKILLVDDEPEIHKMTMGVLDDFVFENRALEFHSAYSGKEAKEFMRKETDISLILLDVVMESDIAGLEVAKYIREELNNTFVRIVLRTGQPGLSPEKEVILDYDINDYKSKTELTVQKLFTTVVSSLRSYRDLRLIEQNMKVIEKNREGLAQIIESSSHLFELTNFRRFTSGVLIQLLSLLHLNDSSFYCQSDDPVKSYREGVFHIHAATGRFEEWIDKPLEGVLTKEMMEYMRGAEESDHSFFQDDVYIEYFRTGRGITHMLYVEGCSQLTDLDKELIQIFSRNVTIACENINFREEIVETQKEVIYTLGELVENRSKTLVNHTRRISEISYLIALHARLGEEEAQLLRMAAPMHDVGKVCLPYEILMKKGELTEDEYEIVKKHSTIGYDILKDSTRKVLQTGALIAHQHQEKWDGSGYPQGLKGEEIHIFGRITGLVDVFDSLTHDRCYRDAWVVDEALEYIKSQRGKHFDPDLVDIFFDNLDGILALHHKLSHE